MIDATLLQQRLAAYFRREAEVVVRLIGDVLEIAVRVEALPPMRVGFYVQNIQQALDNGANVDEDIYNMLVQGFNPEFQRQRVLYSVSNPSMN